MIPAISGAIGALGPSEWSVGQIGGLGPEAAIGTGSGNGSGSFSGALSNAINSIETAQSNADTASQQLATGQLTDPTQAITAIENASLAMDLAAQLRTKFVEAAQTVFQTQM